MKKAIIIGGLALVAILGFRAYTKVQEYTAILSQLRAWPSKVKSFQIKALNKIKVVIDLDVQNPTSTAFSVTTGNTATLKKVMVFMGNTFLGTIEVNRSDIEIPAYGTTIIENLPLEFNPLGAALALLQMSNLDASALKVEAVVNILGTDYTIKQ
nr:hypothetical protein [uncultured Flavobacterium sp.]